MYLSCAHSREKPIQDAPSRMSPRIAPMHVHCEFTTVECREPLLELCSGDNGSRLLNIEVKCSHLRAKTGRISGHLPTEHGTLSFSGSGWPWSHTRYG